VENVAHTLCGLAVADSGFSSRVGRKTAWWTAAITSNLPDLDILTLPILGRNHYMEWHRGVTHSLLACLVIPPLIALIASKVAKQEFKPLWLLATLCYAAHLALDVPTIWGTMLLLPFSDARISLPWVFIVDIFFLVILTLPYWLGRFTALPRATLSRFSLGLLAVYILFCGGMHQLAVNDVHAAAERQGLGAEHVAAYPAPFLPILWNGVAHDGDIVYQTGLRVIGGYETELHPVGARNLDHPAVKATLETHVGKRFIEWWAGTPTAEIRCSGPMRVVIFRDLKFMSPWLDRTGFALIFRLDPGSKRGTWKVVGQEWRTPLDTLDDLPWEECPLRAQRKRN
jgi:inner membrane protein